MTYYRVLCWWCVILCSMCIYLCSYRGRRVIGICGSLIWWKTLMEPIIKPCGEFRWSSEGPVSQTHSSPPRWCPWNLFRSFKVCSDAKESGVQKATGNYLTYSSLVKLQPRFLSLQWKICLWTELQSSWVFTEGSAFGQNTDDIYWFFQPSSTNLEGWHLFPLHPVYCEDQIFQFMHMSAMLSFFVYRFRQSIVIIRTIPTRKFANSD